MTVGLRVKDLDWAIVEAADAPGVVDRLLDRMAHYLNRRKIKKLKAKIEEFEQHAQRLDLKRQEIATQVAALESKIAALDREERQFKARDVLTLGVTYGVRRGVKGIQQGHYERVLAQTQRKIEKLRTKGERVRARADEMEDTLRRMQNQANPSLLARILRWLPFLKNLISSVLDLVIGSVLRSVASLVSTYVTACRL